LLRADAPVTTRSPVATNPPRQRVTDRTCASGSAGSSFFHRIPVHGAAGSGGIGVVNPPEPSGDGEATGDTVGAGVVTSDGEAEATDGVAASLLVPGVGEAGPPDGVPGEVGVAPGDAPEPQH